MKTFYRWIENTSSDIIINLDNYKKEIKAGVDNIIDWHYEHNAKMKAFNFNQDIVLKGTMNYPDKERLFNAIQSRDPKRIFDENLRFHQWISNGIGKPGFNYDITSNAWNHIRFFVDALLQQRKPEEEDDFEKKYMVEVEKIVKQTEKNMEFVKSSIENAIPNIPNWSGSSIIIEAQASFDNRNVEIEPSTHALIHLGSGQMAPYFSLFLHEGKFLIDDVLEGGDTDFFRDAEIQGDYFALINELRNPGSGNKPGKTLTLYTARPVADRRRFENATTVPNNLFLTKSYDFAVGHGADYNVKKDVWKLGIDSRYLTQTFDGPGQEQYQITGGKEVPVKFIKLIDAAE